MISFSGHLRLRAERRGNGRTALTEQSFRAPFHLSKPYWDGDTNTLLVQVVNPTAGILAGDTLESDVAAAPAAALLVTTPSASRVFMMREGRALCRQRLHVGAGAWLEFAPEPLVPHRGADYRQSTEVEVEPGGSLLLVDQLIPGRLAHGESWSWRALELKSTIRVGGRLVLRERFAHDGASLRALAASNGAGEHACFANIVLLAPSADVLPPEVMAAIRALHADGTWLGISALSACGHSIKVVAANPLALRDTVARIRANLAPVYPRLSCVPRKL